MAKLGDMESPPPQIKDVANLRQKPGHAGVTVMQWARNMFSNNAAIPINRIPVHSATILKRANYKAIHNILRVRRTLARFLHSPS